MVADLIDEARAAGVEMPRSVVGQFARQIKKLLDEGIAAERIRAGIEAMIARQRILPSLLPNFVTEASLPRQSARPNPNSLRYGRGVTAATVLAMSGRTSVLG